jgi:hypothetical protein
MPRLGEPEVPFRFESLPFILNFTGVPQERRTPHAQPFLAFARLAPRVQFWMLMNAITAVQTLVTETRAELHSPDVVLVRSLSMREITIGTASCAAIGSQT